MDIQASQFISDISTSSSPFMIQYYGMAISYALYVLCFLSTIFLVVYVFNVNKK